MYCDSTNVVKNGHKRGKQLYKCKDCSRQFVGGQRLDLQKIESDYIDGKQTLSQLAIKYGVCQKQSGTPWSQCVINGSFPNIRMWSWRWMRHIEAGISA